MAEGIGPPASALNSFIPIAELQPSCSPAKAIRSVVALLWPYSASNKSITLLLVEPDFRLRRNKGQVRVEFHGSSAKEVASSGICNGDEVVLSLESVVWERDEAGPRTPGNGVDWKLSFGEKLSMQIRRDSHQLADLNIDYPDLSPESTPNTVTPFGTSVSRTAAPFPASRFIANSDSNAWRSPAFLKRARTSSVSLFDSLYDALAEESSDKPAKRSKVGGVSGQWRYVENLLDQDVGADPDLPVQPTRDAVEIEAGVELAIEGEPADSLPSLIGDLQEWGTNDPANFAVRVQPARGEETETMNRPTLVEDHLLPMFGIDAVGETADLREGPIANTTKDLAFVKGPISGSNSPIYEAQPQRMYGETDSSVANADGSALHPILTAMQTAKTERASPPLEDDVEEAPVLPGSPLLRPTASTGLPLISPIMGRMLMDSSVYEERQDQGSELNHGIEDGYFKCQSTPDPASEVPDQARHATGQSTGDDQDMDYSYFHLVSTSRVEQRQVSEGRNLDSSGLNFPHQKGRDPSDAAIMPTDLVQERLDISKIHARSSLQNMRSEPPSSSVEPAPESDIDDDEDSSTEDFESSSSDEILSEDSDRTESMAEHERWGRASPEEGPSRQTESDDEERNPLTPHRSEYGTDGENKNIELLSIQGPVIIDLEDDSENESQPHATFPDVQNLGEVFPSPFAVSSSPENGSRPSESVLNSSNAHATNNDNPSEYITYPTLPEEDSEQPTPSHSPSSTQSHNTEVGLDPRTGTQLFTPKATEVVHEERSISIELRYDGHGLPTPQPTQTTVAGLLSQEVVPPLADGALLMDELRSPTVPLAGGLGRRGRHVPDVISPWFTLKRSSRMYEASEEDDGSDSQGERTSDSESQDLFHSVEESNSNRTSGLHTSELDTVTTIGNGHAIVQSPRPAPPLVGLRTPLSYFSPLATMHDQFSSTIDVLAIVTSTTSPQRSKSGPKDYYLTLNIIDPSSSSSFTTVQIFRPFKQALPVASKGAAILLRNFKVQSQKHEFVLVSTASSAWAVFEKGQSVQVHGPSVEIGAEERGFAKGLSQWWASLGQDVQGANDE